MNKIKFNAVLNLWYPTVFLSYFNCKFFKKEISFTLRVGYQYSNTQYDYWLDELSNISSYIN